jgi:hypothetical protein
MDESKYNNIRMIWEKRERLGDVEPSFLLTSFARWYSSLYESAHSILFPIRELWPSICRLHLHHRVPELVWTLEPLSLCDRIGKSLANKVGSSIYCLTLLVSYGLAMSSGTIKLLWSLSSWRAWVAAKILPTQVLNSFAFRSLRENTNEMHCFGTADHLQCDCSPNDIEPWSSEFISTGRAAKGTQNVVLQVPGE